MVVVSERAERVKRTDGELSAVGFQPFQRSPVSAQQGRAIPRLAMGPQLSTATSGRQTPKIRNARRLSAAFAADD